MLGLVSNQLHSGNSADASAQNGQGQKCLLADTPFALYSSAFIDAIEYKGQQVNY